MGVTMKYTITNDELVEYLNKVLDSKVYKKIMLSGDIKDTEYFFSLFINVISKYYISTMDDSLKHAEEICYLLYHHTFNEAKSSFMEDVLMDRIVQECSRELGIEDEDKVKKNYRRARKAIVLPQASAY